MNPRIGWLLAVVALFAGGFALGWKGVLLVTSVIIFWLLVQFSQLMRVMRRAGSAPMGRTGDALRLHARIQPGMTLLQVVQAAGALGRKTAQAPDVYEWADARNRVVVTLADAKVQQVELAALAGEPAAEEAGNAPADTPR